MADNKKTLGCSILMMLCGMFPMLIAVAAIFAFPESEPYVVPLCYLLGGILCLTVGRTVLKVDTYSCIRRPEPAALALITAAALGWALADIYIANRAALMGASQTSYSIHEIFTLLSGAFISPAAEELIFRLGMMTVLLIGAGRSTPQKLAAAVISCTPWVLIHFPKDYMRAADLVLTGAVISLIYLLSKNIVYCLAFHMAANCLTMLAAPLSRSFFAHGSLMYAGIIIAAVCLPAALIKMHSSGRCVSFQPLSSIGVS